MAASLKKQSKTFTRTIYYLQIENLYLFQAEIHLWISLFYIYLTNWEWGTDECETSRKGIICIYFLYCIRFSVKHTHLHRQTGICPKKFNFGFVQMNNEHKRNWWQLHLYAIVGNLQTCRKHELAQILFDCFVCRQRHERNRK